MALLYHTGFDHLAAGDLFTVDPSWFNRANGTIIDVLRSSARTGAACMAQVGGANGLHVTRPIGANAATVIVGFAWMPTGSVAGTTPFFRLNNSGTIHLELRASDRKISVHRGDGTLLGTTAADVLTLSSWVFLEVKATIHDTTGAVEIRVNGVVALTLTGQDTRNGVNAYCDEIGFGHATSGSTWRLDDLYVCDDTGAAPYNTYLGDCKTESLLPSAAGFSTQFTPSASTNVSNVDDPFSDGDTTYNSSATAGHKDTFEMGDIATASGTVLAVTVGATFRKDDAGSRTLRTILRSGGADYEGADVIVFDSYTNARTQYTADPADATTWTIAEANAIEAGYKVQA